MNTLSKEYIAETKKEIQRLEGFVRSYQARIETLQELLLENSNHETKPKQSSRKKTSKTINSESFDKNDDENTANA